MNLVTFYNQYHQKNKPYSGVITRQNMTYYLCLQMLGKALGARSKTQRVLDVGCGVGALSLFCAQEENIVVGIDVAPDAIEIAQRAARAAQLPNCAFAVGELGLGKGSFDLVICSEILEHVADESAFLHRVASQLRVGGMLYLSSPSRDVATYQWGWLDKFDKEVGHLRRYSENELRNLIESHGFVVEHIRSVESPLRNALYTTKLGFLVRYIRGPLVPLFHLFDAFVGKLFGFCDIQVVARKQK